MSYRPSRPHVLVAVGLLGITAWQLAERLLHPVFPAHDFVQGIWFGVCLGIEIMGLVLLRRAKFGPTA